MADGWHLATLLARSIASRTALAADEAALAAAGLAAGQRGAAVPAAPVRGGAWRAGQLIDGQRHEGPQDLAAHQAGQPILVTPEIRRAAAGAARVGPHLSGPSP